MRQDREEEIKFNWYKATETKAKELTLEQAHLIVPNPFYVREDMRKQKRKSDAKQTQHFLQEQMKTSKLRKQLQMLKDVEQRKRNVQKDADHEYDLKLIAKMNRFKEWNMKSDLRRGQIRGFQTE